MSLSELWVELEKESLGESSFFGRLLVVIPLEYFQKFDEYFTYSYNPFNKNSNYRTKGAFKHIHAVQSGKYIEFHVDYFNPTVSVFFVIPHLLISVILYFVSLWFRGKKPYKIYL